MTLYRLIIEILPVKLLLYISRIIFKKIRLFLGFHVVCDTSKFIEYLFKIKNVIRTERLRFFIWNERFFLCFFGKVTLSYS